ncbi:hypothetical protein D3C84_431000 [compost metagenome]
MAVYSTSFGTDTTGAAPTGWTSRWTSTGATWLVRADSTATADKYLEFARTTTARRLLAFDSIDSDSNRDNAEIYARFRTDGIGSISQFYLIARGSGAAASENGYACFNNTSSGIGIIKLVAGVSTTLGTVTTATLVSNWYYHVRFRVNGTALKAKIWSGLSPEPAAWDLEITDASISGTGYVGIGNNAATGIGRWDDVAFGTNGDTAVFPTAAETRDTQNPLLVLGAGSGISRETQLAALVLGGTLPNIRETQFAALVMAAPSPPIRGTQFAALPLVEFFAATPITQIAALVLAEHIPCTTQWAQTWTITRTDGQVFAYTSLDRPLTFRGVVHSPCNSLSATATEQSTTIGASGNMELIGIISDVGISEHELYNGLFDFARFEVWMVPWFNHGGETPFRLMAGTTGTMTHGVEGFKFEVLTGSANLRQKALLEVFTPSCRYGFGSSLDARCPVNLAAITVAGSATSTAVPAASNQATRRIVIDATRAEAAGHFDLGILTWTSGPNAGASSEIKRFESGTFVLWSPLLFPIEVGDTYTATPGCNKSPADHMRFNADMVDYGGFPDVPGSDSINQFPDSKG